MKKLISLLLAIICLMGTLVISANATTPEAVLYHTYQNSMIFQHDKPITLAGTADVGSVISFEIYDKNSKKVRSANGVAGDDGCFEVTCNKGILPSYDAYTIKAYDDGVLFATLSDVMFGVVWMASGQSNMQFDLGSSTTGAEMKKNGTVGSQYLRFMSVPALPKYNGSSDLCPLNPLNDIQECKWVKGNTTDIYDLSAVGYYFGEKLQAQLNLPVGVICNPLGGSSIYTWLSREAIEGNEEVLNDTILSAAYVAKSAWATTAINSYLTMTTNFNKKVYAMRFFKIDGMIWYQGESNTSNAYGAYKRALRLLQDSYSELFGFEDCLMPLVCTEIANYHYGDQKPDLASVLNIQFGELQKERPDSVAQVTTYGIDLSYGALGPIHPSHKYEVADKLSYAALGLVYNLHNAYSAPVMRHTRISGSNVYVSFDNVGDGLVAKQVTKESSPLIYGFSICGTDGNYVSANATIVDECTVKVSNVFVTNPEAVSYAYTENTQHCNLFSSEDGEPVFGATPFITYLPVTTHFNDFKEWMECDFEDGFRSAGETQSGLYPVWQQDGSGTFVYDYKDKKRGAASLFAAFTDSGYILRPVLTYKDGNDLKVFGDEDNDYSDYAYMGFWIKNTSDKAITLSKVKFYTNKSTYYCPVVVGSKNCSFIVPANSDWLSVVLDLNNLKLSGSIGSYQNNKLEDVYNIEFCFDKDKSAAYGTVKLDYFFLSPETNGVTNTYDQKYQVTYCGNKGINVPEAEKTATTSNYTITSEIPTRKGFTFVKWNTLADGSGTSYLPNNIYREKKDAVLYAIWKKNDFNVKGNIQYDSAKGIISGIDYDDLGLTVLENSILNDNLNVLSENDKYSTGTLLRLTDIRGNVLSSAVLVIFGDVDQDGVCDGNDAVIAEMLNSGMLTAEQLGVASYKAADCNHDGKVNANDMDLMFSAGLGKSQIRQTNDVEIQMQSDNTVTEITFFDILLKLFELLKNCFKLFVF